MRDEEVARLTRDLVDSKHPKLHPAPETPETPAPPEEKEDTALTSNDDLIIPWFYLGDLVNVVVEHAVGNNKDQGPSDKFSPTEISEIELANLVYLLGTFDYSLSMLDGSQDQFKTGMLSAIPITVNSFSNWFVKRVVNADRDSFPLLEFLRSFIQDVVVGLLNRECFNYPEFRKAWVYPSAAGRDRPWLKVAPVILKTTSISLPSDSPSPAGTSPSLSTAEFRNKLGPNPLERLRKWPSDPATSANGTTWDTVIDLDKFNPSTNLVTKRDNSHDQTLTNSYHTTMFYLISQDSYKTLGTDNIPEYISDTVTVSSAGSVAPGTQIWSTARENRDFEQGIFHLYLGADVGLVKEISFSKVDAPYLREARLQQDSLNPLALLAATYNVNLKLIGNTIFWPGQYIFVNPIGYGYGIGLPDVRGTVSNQLGLGGYHLVTKVKSYVEEGRFETEVNALFEFSGDGCPSLPKAKASPCSEVSNATEITVPTPSPGKGTT